MDGIININKPEGKTSFDVVSIVRRLSGERRVGHAGTLDPFATGVLPVCLGRGTKVIQFLVDDTKAYRAQIELGVATDTYDVTGKIVHRGDPSGINQELLESALVSFRGLIQQTPPMYSAVKYHGKPLYKLAREGITVERESRPIHIHKLTLMDWQSPIVTLEIVCGKGTYIRSLAHDLGEALGCGANLQSLIRLRCGLFDIKEAVTVFQLEEAFRYGYWQHFVYPIDVVLLPWAAVVVSNDTGKIIRNGGTIDCPAQRAIGSSCENRCRVYTSDGCFLGLLRFDSEKGQWQPEKIFCN